MSSRQWLRALGQWLRPSPDDTVDAVFAVAGSAVAGVGLAWMTGMGTWVAVSIMGWATALLALMATGRGRYGVGVGALGMLTGYLLLAAPVLVRHDLVMGVVPRPAALGELVRLPVTAWKDWLTALAPGDGSGIRAVVFFVAMVGVGVTWHAAMRVAVPAIVVPMLGAQMIVVGALGPMRAGVVSVQPSILATQGVAMALIMGAWLWVRARRLDSDACGTPSAGLRALVLAVTFSLATATALFVLPTADAARTSLRAVQGTEIEVLQSRVANPLSAYRGFVQSTPSGVRTRELFRVHGVPTGTLVTLAVLDAYTEAGWSPGTGSLQGGSVFHLTGERITREEPKARAEFVLKPGWDGGCNCHLPVPGDAVSARVSLSGHAVLRNPQTGALLLSSPAGVGRDDIRFVVRYTQQALVPGQRPFGEVNVVGRNASAVATPGTADIVAFDALIRTWTAGSATPAQALSMVATRLRTGGYYTHGDRGTPAQTVAPGHDLARLYEFASAAAIVGDDEQYASTFALMANRMGVPARVVVGVPVPSGGVVHGAQIRAWVEVSTVRGWAPVPPGIFTPPTSRAPDSRALASAVASRPTIPALRGSEAAPMPGETPAASTAASRGAPVPAAPATARSTSTNAAPASGISTPNYTIATSPESTEEGSGLGVLGAVLGGVLCLAGLVTAGVPLTKLARRVRRRRRGSPAHRIAAGWQDVVDTLRDNGIDVSPTDTRLEAAARADDARLMQLARRCDDLEFGVASPTDADARTYWGEVDVARSAIVSARSRRGRLVAACSTTSLTSRDEEIR